MPRVKMKDLEAAVRRLNRLTESPEVPWTHETGKLTANIGNYHLSGAYGGWTLHRLDTAGGGVTEPLRCGYVSKRELLTLIHAFINGIESSRG